MTHTYKVSGMTCSGCEFKVKKALLSVPGVTRADVSNQDASATVTMESTIPTSAFQNALGDGKYSISEMHHEANPMEFPSEEAKSWIATYKPILLIFGYILAVTLLVQANNDRFDWMQAMRHFMSGFFLVFSFFKMLNLKGFAESYVMYDVVAQKIPAWAYVYAFVELGLGVAFLTDFDPFITNLVTLIVMSLSIIGVLQSVLNKRKIQCACLGAVFNLPMSTVTIIEDGLMIAMSAVMLAMVF